MPQIYAWTPPAGGGSKFVFRGRGGGADPEGWGPRNFTTVPHYAWLVAVDPRGAVLMAGVGGHGVVRARLREAAGDPEVVTVEVRAAAPGRAWRLRLLCALRFAIEAVAGLGRRAGMGSCRASAAEGGGRRPWLPRRVAAGAGRPVSPQGAERACVGHAPRRY